MFSVWEVNKIPTARKLLNRGDILQASNKCVHAPNIL